MDRRAFLRAPWAGPEGFYPLPRNPALAIKELMLANHPVDSVQVAYLDELAVYCDEPANTEASAADDGAWHVTPITEPHIIEI